MIRFAPLSLVLVLVGCNVSSDPELPSGTAGSLAETPSAPAAPTTTGSSTDPSPPALTDPPPPSTLTTSDPPAAADPGGFVSDLGDAADTKLETREIARVYNMNGGCVFRTVANLYAWPNGPGWASFYEDTILEKMNADVANPQCPAPLGVRRLGRTARSSRVGPPPPALIAIREGTDDLAVAFTDAGHTPSFAHAMKIDPVTGKTLVTLGFGVGDGVPILGQSFYPLGLFWTGNDLDLVGSGAEFAGATGTGLVVRAAYAELRFNTNAIAPATSAERF